MSKRDSSLYINDILDSIEAIEEFTFNINYETFINDRKTYSATLREFMVIGEAISKIIDLLQEKKPNYPWRMIKDFRNFIIHEYFGVNPQIIYDAVKLELPELKTLVLEFK